MAFPIAAVAEGVAGGEIGAKVIIGILRSIKDTMVKSSPQLMQSVELLKKGILLYLRPIGDLMSKLFRPFLIIFIKAGLLWYKYLSKIFGTGGDTPEANKKLEEVAAELAESTQSTGSPEVTGTDSRPDGNSSGAGPNFGGFQKTFDDMKKSWDVLMGDGRTFWDNIKKTFALGDLMWEGIELGAKAVWEVGKVIFGVIETVGKAAFKFFEEIYYAVAEGMRIGAKVLWELATTVFTAIDVAQKIFFQFITLIWENIKKDWTAITTAVDLIWQEIKKAWDEIAKVVSNIWAEIKKAFIEKIKSLVLKPKKETEDSKAVGGAIDRTGLYQLHAGERVVTAGDNSRSRGGNTYNFSMPVTINATMNSDTDIRQLARKLAALQETELRRRVSY